MGQTKAVGNGVVMIGWRDGQEVAVPQDLPAVQGLLADESLLLWVDLCHPDAATLGQLAEHMRLDRHAVEDALSPRERPKAMWHPSHIFLTVYAAALSQGAGEEVHDSRLVLHRIAAFVLRGCLITVRPDDGFDMDTVVERWLDESELLTHGSGALLHGLLDTIVDGHFVTIQAMDDAIEDLEDRLFEGHARRMHIQEQVYRIRKELVQLRRVVLPMREVVSAVMRRPVQKNDDHFLDGFYNDLYDHVMRATEWTESLRDMVATIFETNLSLQDAHLNVVMKKLAGWAAVIAVPTAVTGWFGQNVPFPGNGAMFGLIMSALIIVAGTVGVYAALRHFDWI